MKTHVVVRGSLYVFPTAERARYYCAAWLEWRRAIDKALAEYGEDVGQYRDAPDPAAFDGKFIARPLVIEDAQDAQECVEILDTEMSHDA